LVGSLIFGEKDADRSSNASVALEGSSTLLPIKRGYENVTVRQKKLRISHVSILRIEHFHEDHPKGCFLVYELAYCTKENPTRLNGWGVLHVEYASESEEASDRRRIRSLCFKKRFK
jgi:hypothetical protein